MKKVSKTEEILEGIDDELLKITPGTDSYMKLLEQREKLVKMEKDEKKTIDPNTILTVGGALLQVTAVAVVGFLTRLDKDALRFTNVIKP